jgi:O-acetyl-ADP-ribose deacetylase (regulator of RNase III)
MANVSVQIGDVTTLAVDVIVNAANEQQGDFASRYMNS